MHNGKMHIACPHCLAVYDVPESRLGSVLFLRCGVCAHRWPFVSAKPETVPSASQPLDSSRPLTPSSDEAMQARRLNPEAADSLSRTSAPESIVSVTIESVTVASVSTASSLVEPSTKPAFHPADTARKASQSIPDPDPNLEQDPFAAQPAQAAYAAQSAVLRTSRIKNSFAGWNWISVSLWAILLCLIFVTVAVLARHEIIKLIPASARLFGRLGLLS